MDKTAEIQQKQLIMKYVEMNTKTDCCEVLCVCVCETVQFLNSNSTHRRTVVS